MSLELLLAEILRWHILIGLLIMLLIFLLVRWAGRRTRGKVQLYFVQGGIVIVLVALMTLVVTHQLSWLFAVFGGAIPIVMRLVQVLEGTSGIHNITSRRSRSSSSSSRRRLKVQTRFLRISFEKKSGSMRGKVLKGAFAGKHLSELSPKQLRQLYRQYGEQDEESGALLATYLKQVHGDKQKAEDAKADHAESSNTNKGAGDNGAHRRATKDKGMSLKEAYEILGLADGADAQAVTDAHRRLMQKLHPDRGGTNYLAAKINHAKDLLLARAAR